jgi:hypothetical protein
LGTEALSDPILDNGAGAVSPARETAQRIQPMRATLKGAQAEVNVVFAAMIPKPVLIVEIEWSLRGRLGAGKLLTATMVSTFKICNLLIAGTIVITNGMRSTGRADSSGR